MYSTSTERPDRDMTVTATFSSGKTIKENTNRKVGVAWGLKSTEEGTIRTYGFSRDTASAKRTASKMRKATGFGPNEMTVEIVEVD